ncbi:MAG: hypothetical protein K5662_05695 [Lachnospiraceae bacterium]|nr:hypothetical protein [Lachnospiraceae bacterium]
MIVSFLVLLIIMGVIPLGLGVLPALFVDRNSRSIPFIYVAGFITSLAVFQLVAVPIIIVAPFGFRIIVPLYLILTILLATAGYVLMALDIRKNGRLFKDENATGRLISREEKFEWVIFFILFGFQLIMYFRMTSFDGDDAYYVVQSLLTYETDTLYRIMPYTGLSTAIDLRHSFATVPVWIAYIAKLSGIHPTIIAHSVIGFVLLTVTYMIFYLSTGILLKKEPKRVPIMMILICVLHIFGNVSIYTNATFLLTRTWQGKSMLANIAIPAVIWLLLAIFDTEIEQKKRLGYWIVLFLINVVAAMCSTASVFLIAMLVGLSGVVLTVINKNIQILLRLMITCVPLVISGVLYLLL